MLDKRADFAGPALATTGSWRRLPQDYQSLLYPNETQKAIFAAKSFIEQRLCEALNLMMVTVPLIVGAESGVNDYLDRDGSRTPIQFHISNDRDRHPVDTQIVQAATKWKRMSLKRFDMAPGEASARTCGRCARTTFWTKTSASTWTSGIGKRPSAPRTAIWISSSRPSTASGR